MERGHNIIPTSVADYLKEDLIYNKLIDFEKEIDQKISKKQTQIADASFKAAKVKRILRITVHHTWENLHNQSRVTDDASMTVSDLVSPSWTLCIEGRLESMAKTKKSFSTFFKSVIVQLGLEDDMVEWHKTKDTPESDGFEIKRMGTNDLNARIYLKLDYQPEKYRPSPALAAILDLELVTKPAAILAVWQYIKMHKLQESDEKKIISNDALLKNVFKCDKMTFSEIPLRIDSHLLPPESIELEYLISLDRLEGSSTWEVEVEIDDMTKPRPVAANVMSQQREIGLLDQKIHECSLALKGSLINLKVLEEFASDPIACIHKLMEAHVRDQEIVSGHEPHITLGDLLKPGTFDTEEMEKTIALFLTKN